jgi:hypothetical protein
LIYKIVGRDNKATIEIDFPAHTSEQDIWDIVHKLKEIIDTYDTVEELASHMDETVRKLGLEVWSTH